MVAEERQKQPDTGNTGDTADVGNTGDRGATPDTPQTDPKEREKKEKKDTDKSQAVRTAIKDYTMTTPMIQAGYSAKQAAEEKEKVQARLSKDKEIVFQATGLSNDMLKQLPAGAVGVYAEEIRNIDSAEAYTKLRKQIMSDINTHVSEVEKYQKNISNVMTAVSRRIHNTNAASQGEFGKMVTDSGELAFMTEREKQELRKELEPSKALISWLQDNEPDKFKRPERHAQKKTAMAEAFANALTAAMSSRGPGQATMTAVSQGQAVTAGRMAEQRRLTYEERQRVDEKNYEIMQKYRANNIKAMTVLTKAQDAAGRAYVHAKMKTLERRQQAYLSLLNADVQLQQMQQNAQIARGRLATSVEKSKEQVDQFNVKQQNIAKVENIKARNRARMATMSNRMQLLRVNTQLQEAQKQNVLRGMGLTDEGLQDAAAATHSLGIGIPFQKALDETMKNPVGKSLMQTRGTQIAAATNEAISGINEYIKAKYNVENQYEARKRMYQNWMVLSRAGFVLDGRQDRVREQLDRQNLIEAAGVGGEGPSLKISEDALKELDSKYSLTFDILGNVGRANKAELARMAELKRIVGDTYAVSFGNQTPSTLAQLAEEKRRGD